MKTIRGRLLMVLLPGLAIVLLAGGAGIYWLAKAKLIGQLDASLQLRLEALASLVTADQRRIEFEFHRDQETELGDVYFEFHASDDRLLRRSTNLGEMTIRGSVDASSAQFRDVQLPGGRTGRAGTLSFQPRMDDPEEARSSRIPTAQSLVTVDAAVDRGPVDRALRTLLGALSVAGFLVAGVSAALIGLGVRWGLVPLDRLSSRMGKIGGETISERISDDGAPLELLPVHRELNALLDRVESTIERERAFADAAAHELRTPLAELRTTAEVAVRWPDESRAPAALREVLDIGNEMERLVEALLLISRGNSSEATSGERKTNIAPLVRECVDQVRSRAEQKRLQLALDLTQTATLPAPPSAVAIIIRNLVDNAVSYTPQGGSLRVRSQGSDNGNAVLVVENGPVDLSEQALQHMFDPFWRNDQARSSREHFGLGLAVVRRIAHAVGLQVEASLHNNHLQMRVSSSNHVAGSAEAGA